MAEEKQYLQELEQQQEVFIWETEEPANKFPPHIHSLCFDQDDLPAGVEKLSEEIQNLESKVTSVFSGAESHLESGLTGKSSSHLSLSFTITF